MNWLRFFGWDFSNGSKKQTSGRIISPDLIEQTLGLWHLPRLLFLIFTGTWRLNVGPEPGGYQI